MSTSLRDFLMPIVLTTCTLGALYGMYPMLPHGNVPLPNPDLSQDPQVVGLDGFMRAGDISGNALMFKDTYQGKPVRMNVDLDSVVTSGSDVVVSMEAYRRSSHPVVEAMASTHLVTCTFHHPTQTSPLSSWRPHQEILLTGTFGDDAQTLEHCSLSAYVDGNGRLAMSNSMTDMINGTERKLDSAQVFPPPPHGAS